jgi:hypothetical protein
MKQKKVLRNWWRKIGNHRQYIFILPLLLFFAIATYFIVTTSFSVRYWADDFCIATVQSKYGLWEAQKFWWDTWSGRYSYNFMLHVFVSSGEWIVRIIPSLIYSGLVLSILPVFLIIFNHNKYKLLKSILLANFLIIVILINAPNIVQSFYWQTGALAYSMPFIFFNLFLTSIFLVGKNLHEKGWKNNIISFSFLLTFIGSGFVETFAVAQTVFIVLMIIGSYIIKFSGRTQIRKALFAGLLGSVVGMVVMTASPGVRVRQTTITQAESLIFILKSTFLGSKWYLQRFLSIKTSIYSLVALFSLIYYNVSKYYKRVGKKIKIKIKDLFVATVFSVFLVIITTISVFGVSYYAMAYLPPERALFIVVYFIFIAFVVFSTSVSLLVNVLLKSKQTILNNINIFLYLISMTLLFHSFYSHWGILRYRMEDYARHWDIQEQEIYRQKNNDSDVVIEYVRPVGDIDGFVENKGWVSACAAVYYQVDEIRVVE